MEEEVSGGFNNCCFCCRCGTKLPFSPRCMAHVGLEWSLFQAETFSLDHCASSWDYINSCVFKVNTKENERNMSPLIGFLSLKKTFLCCFSAAIQYQSTIRKATDASELLDAHVCSKGRQGAPVWWMDSQTGSAVDCGDRITCWIAAVSQLQAMQATQPAKIT